MSFYGLPRKHVPSIYHVVLLRNPERAPCIRNHAFALVAALDWTEYEGLAGGVHLVAGQHVALAVKQIPSPRPPLHLLEPVPTIGRIAAVCKLIPPALAVCGRLKALGVCHWDRGIINIPQFKHLLPGRGRYSGLDSPVVDALGLNTPTITYVHPDVARLPDRPADHGLVQVVNSYPLHGRVMIVVAATQDTCVPADKTTAVRAALAYVLSLLARKKSEVKQVYTLSPSGCSLYSPLRLHFTGISKLDVRVTILLSLPNSASLR